MECGFLFQRNVSEMKACGCQKKDSECNGRQIHKQHFVEVSDNEIKPESFGSRKRREI